MQDGNKALKNLTMQTVEMLRQGLEIKSDSTNRVVQVKEPVSDNFSMNDEDETPKELPQLIQTASPPKKTTISGGKMTWQMKRQLCAQYDEDEEEISQLCNNREEHLEDDEEQRESEPTSSSCEMTAPEEFGSFDR